MKLQEHHLLTDIKYNWEEERKKKNQRKNKRLEESKINAEPQIENLSDRGSGGGPRGGVKGTKQERGRMKEREEGRFLIARFLRPDLTRMQPMKGGENSI